MLVFTFFFKVFSFFSSDANTLLVTYPNVQIVTNVAVPRLLVDFTVKRPRHILLTKVQYASGPDSFCMDTLQ